MLCNSVKYIFQSNHLRIGLQFLMADWSGELEGVLIPDGHFPLQCLGDQAVEVFARGLVDVHPATVGVGEGV